MVKSKSCFTFLHCYSVHTARKKQEGVATVVSSAYYKWLQGQWWAQQFMCMCIICEKIFECFHWSNVPNVVGNTLVNVTRPIHNVLDLTRCPPVDSLHHSMLQNQLCLAMTWQFHNGCSRVPVQTGMKEVSHIGLTMAAAQTGGRQKDRHVPLPQKLPTYSHNFTSKHRTPAHQLQKSNSLNAWMFCNKSCRICMKFNAKSNRGGVAFTCLACVTKNLTLTGGLTFHSSLMSELWAKSLALNISHSLMTPTKQKLLVSTWYESEIRGRRHRFKVEIWGQHGFFCLHYLQEARQTPSLYIFTSTDQI